MNWRGGTNCCILGKQEKHFTLLSLDCASCVCVSKEQGLKKWKLNWKSVLILLCAWFWSSFIFISLDKNLCESFVKKQLLWLNMKSILPTRHSQVFATFWVVLIFYFNALQKSQFIQEILLLITGGMSFLIVKDLGKSSSIALKNMLTWKRTFFLFQ